MDNRTHFVVGSGRFINNDDPLLVWESFNVLTHLQNAGDAEETELHQWNEDGIMADFRFSLDATKNVVLNSLKLALVFSNGTNTVELDSVNVVLNPNIGNPPQIATNDIRNYILPTNSEFNLVKIDNDGSALPKEFYRGIIGQKITWQEWIRNNNIPALFLNFAQLNNGLNQKSDNYSGENGYEIYLKATAEVTGDDSVQGTITRTYEILSSVINVYDYFESDDGVITAGDIETWDATETINLNGAILQNSDTLFKITWRGAAPLDLADLGYIIHRIESKNAPSNLQIEESSTFRGIVPNGKLTSVTTQQVGNDIVSRCFIKAGSLGVGVWKLSGRIKTPGLPTAFGWILIHHTNPNGRNAVFTAREDIFANNKTFFSVNNATNSADFRFRIGDSTTALNDANDGGWAAFAEIDFATFVGAVIPQGAKVRVSYVGANTTDTDLLTAIKVATNENVIATTTNTIYTNSKIAANDVLLPFQTQNNVDVVTSQFSTNKFSNVRTDAEIAASSDLTDFVTGIGSLVNLNTDAYGHLFAENTTTNGIGQLSIQTTANDANEGSVVGIASPLQNFAYPVTGNGINVLATKGDAINDLLFSQAGATGSDLLFPELMAIGEERSYTILGKTGQFGIYRGASGSIMRDTGSCAVRLLFDSGGTQFFIFENSANPVQYITFTYRRTAIDNYEVECFRNGRKVNITNTGKSGSFATFPTGTYNYFMGCGNADINNLFRSGGLRFFAMHNRILTKEEIRRIHLGSDVLVNHSPLYFFDFTNLVPDGGNRTIPNQGSGLIDALKLENNTNTPVNLF